MKSVVVIALLVVGLPFGLFAAEKPYQGATILSVTEKTDTRVVYYVVDTPITKDDTYSEVSLQLKNTDYVARYVPHGHEPLPAEWIPGSTVQVKVAGRRLFVKQAAAPDLELIVTRRKAQKSADTPSDAIATHQ